MHSYVISDHELKKGFTVLNELLEKDPEATEAQFGLAKILFYMGRLNEAIAMMEKIVTATKTPDPDYLLWAAFMAYIRYHAAKSTNSKTEYAKKCQMYAIKCI